MKAKLTYSQRIEQTLRPKKNKDGPVVIDLFSGCGGLSLGFEAVGYSTIGYEMDEDACNSYRSNLNGDCLQVKLTRRFDFPKAEVIIGGPPCQPFSVLGNQLGKKDSRNCFPILVSAIEKVRPKIFLIENVKGILFRNENYLRSLINKFKKLGYTTSWRVLNAKHYEVAQNRERIIIVGIKKSSFAFPNANKYLVTAGEALRGSRREIPKESKILTKTMDSYILRYEQASNCITPRDLDLDKPARTLTCRNLVGMTGDMHRIKMANGKRRTLTIREAARLQSFPDWFTFSGSETSVFNQIGNAVPPMFSYHLAKSVKYSLMQP